MANKKTTRKPAVKAKAIAQEKDALYMLKLLLYMFVGVQWLRIDHGGTVFPIPLGLIIGLAFAMHEHFRIDRKVEFAILLVVALVGFITQSGMYITY